MCRKCGVFKQEYGAARGLKGQAQRLVRFVKHEVGCIVVKEEQMQGAQVSDGPAEGGAMGVDEEDGVTLEKVAEVVKLGNDQTLRRQNVLVVQVRQYGQERM